MTAEADPSIRPRRVPGRAIEPPPGCGRGDHLWFGSELHALGTTLFVQAPIGAPHDDSEDRPAICVAEMDGGAPDWRSTVELPFDEMGRSRFFSIAAHGDHLAVSYRGNEGCEGVHLHRRIDDAWPAVGHVEPPEGRSQTDFGEPLVFAGDLLITGSLPGVELPHSALRAYRHVGDELREVGGLPVPPGATSFGGHLAASPSGQWLAAVTTHGERELAVELYARRDDAYGHVQTLFSAGEIRSLAVSDDHLAFGVLAREGADGGGWVQTYRLDGGAWREDRRLSPPDGGDPYPPGFSVAIHGHRLAISQPLANTIFVVDLGSDADTTWCQLAPTPDPGSRAFTGGSLAWVGNTLFASSRARRFYAFDTEGCFDEP
ncbi:MAG: hypothetical protein KC619_13515 [Myxococcales bacterium]|nr:hypothetical protein [Myxococcales bacterium]